MANSRRTSTQVNVWRNHELPDIQAKEMIYDAYVLGGIDAAKHLARATHQAYFEPKHEEFAPRTAWSLQNAFTEAFKALEPLPQYRATASLGEFLKKVH